MLLLIAKVTSYLNSFIANAATAEAKRLLEQNMRTQLCQEDAIAFITALERPAKNNACFIQAARQHKAIIKNEGSTA